MTDLSMESSEWVDQFDALQLSLNNQTTEQDFLSYLDAAISNKIQADINSGESAIPETPMRVVVFLEQEVPIFQTDVQKTANDALKALPYAILAGYS